MRAYNYNAKPRGRQKKWGMCVFVCLKASVEKKNKISFRLKGQSYITSYLAFKGILLS